MGRVEAIRFASGGVDGGVSALPYDPARLERLRAEARARREAVLRERARPAASVPAPAVPHPMRGAVAFACIAGGILIGTLMSAGVPPAAPLVPLPPGPTVQDAVRPPSAIGSEEAAVLPVAVVAPVLRPAIGLSTGGSPDAPPFDEGGPPWSGREASLIFALHAPPSVDADTRASLTEALRLNGWPVDDPVTVGFTISETHLRYYHAADLEQAADVADRLDLPLRDFTAYRPSPRTGLVEIWMSGRASSSAPSAPAPVAVTVRGVPRPTLLQRVERLLRAPGRRLRGRNG